MWNDISHLDEVMPGPLRLSPALAKEE